MLEKFLNNLNSAVDKLQDFAKKESGGKTSTIVHPEIFSSKEEANKATKNFSFRAFHSSDKEFCRRMKGY